MVNAVDGPKLFKMVCEANETDLEIGIPAVMLPQDASASLEQSIKNKYGEQAAKMTNEGLDAVGYAIGTAWAVFKIRKALNPKSVIKPTTFAKAAVEVNSVELKAKHKK
ncbi:hypothetical protein F0562_022312 [Nyssa sinensis]|uniref:Senescence domain-containing protein n=1 Tax=Nyssa sinensis TaxID=561372 RepID=A0A5J5BQB4_9ASTE|nr:hypothetical protein F0562_022312 [Nyssa sinensis]